MLDWVVAGGAACRLHRTPFSLRVSQSPLVFRRDPFVTMLGVQRSKWPERRPGSEAGGPSSGTNHGLTSVMKSFALPACSVGFSAAELRLPGSARR